MCDSCPDGIANGLPPPVTSCVSVSTNLFLANSLTTTNIFATTSNVNTLNVSSISLPTSYPFPGFVLTTTDTGGVVWAPQTGGSGTSQWTGTTGYPIYYVPNVGIGSSDPPTANLAVTGNVYVSNAIQTTNVYTQLVQISGSIQGSGALFYDSFENPYTTAISSDGTSMVIAYPDSSRLELYNIENKTTYVLDIDNYSPYSVAINGNATVVVAGAPVIGCIFIYRNTRGNWPPPIQINNNANFGYSVSINDVGDTILVAEISTSLAGNDGGEHQGVAYMYTYDGSKWNLTTTFSVSDPISSVALSGDGTTCVFGMPSYNTTGGVYVTKDLGQTYTILPGDTSRDWFGYYVSVNSNGTRIVANSSVANEGYNYIKIFTLQ